jgi:hypothetical protein
MRHPPHSVFRPLRFGVVRALVDGVQRWRPSLFQQPPHLGMEFAQARVLFFPEIREFLAGPFRSCESLGEELQRSSASPERLIQVLHQVLDVFNAHG